MGLAHSRPHRAGAPGPLLFSTAHQRREQKTGFAPRPLRSPISSASKVGPKPLPVPWGCGLGRTGPSAPQGTGWGWRPGSDLRKQTQDLREETPARTAAGLLPGHPGLGRVTSVGSASKGPKVSCTGATGEGAVQGGEGLAHRPLSGRLAEAGGGSSSPSDTRSSGPAPAATCCSSVSVSDGTSSDQC